MRSVVLMLGLVPWLAFAATPKEKLALIPARSPGVPAGEENTIEELVAAEVAKTNRYDVLSTSDVSAEIGLERQRQLLGCDEGSECLKELAAGLGAAKLMVVSISMLGEGRVLSLKLIDFGTSRVLKRETEQVKSTADVPAACHRLVFNVLDLPLEVARVSSGPRAGWFVLGGGVALAIGGVALGVSANSDAQQFRSREPFNDGLANQANTKAHVADGLYAGAIVAGIVAGAMLIFGRSDP